MGGNRSYDPVNFGIGRTGFAGLIFPFRGQAHNPVLRSRPVLMLVTLASVRPTALLVFSRNLMQSAPDDAAWISAGYFAVAGAARLQGTGASGASGRRQPGDVAGTLGGLG